MVTMIPLPTLLISIFANLIFVVAFVFYVINTKKYVPEAAIFKKARKQKRPIAIVHYPGGSAYPYLPEEEKEAEGLNPPYWNIPEIGLKFKTKDGSKLERWMGEIPLYNYFVNCSEPIALKYAVAFSQLKDMLKSRGIEIDTIEDVAFYVLSEYEKTKDLDLALENAQIDDGETIEQVKMLLKYVIENKEEIENERIKSGLFTYQTCTTAIDSIIMYATSNLMYAKTVIEAAVRREAGKGVSDMIKYGIFVFLCMIGLGALFVLVRG